MKKHFFIFCLLLTTNAFAEIIFSNGACSFKCEGATPEGATCPTVGWESLTGGGCTTTQTNLIAPGTCNRVAGNYCGSGNYFIEFTSIPELEQVHQLEVAEVITPDGHSITNQAEIKAYLDKNFGNQKVDANSEVK